MAPGSETASLYGSCISWRSVSMQSSALPTCSSTGENIERPNMPGTTQQWPNWSLALPQPLEAIQTAELPRAIASALTRR